ncbi:MAG: hypothetical protein ACLQVY_06715 [Limisphaerales bacterium]
MKKASCNKLKLIRCSRALLPAALFCQAPGASAADQTVMDSASLQKPAWLTEASASVREGYDNNVFMSGVDPKYYPSYTVPSGSVAALENRSSWITTISPKVGFNFAPLLGKQGPFELLSLIYAPDFVMYHDASSENYDAHRFITAVKGKADNLSFSLDNTASYIDGSDKGPLYPGGLLDAWATVWAAQRREQLQDRAKLALQYDWDNCFARATASLSYYGFMTDLMSVEGYQNYPNRYDLNGGLDFGYKVSPETALTVGFREGHQYQQSLAFSPYSSSSDYQRALVGAEGKPLKWLTMSLQAGPDFRSYQGDTATHITPLSNLHPVTYYAEASITAEASSRDLFALKYRQFQWVSICGKIPYFDSTYDLSYHRKLNSQLALDLGARALEADYNSGDIAASHRNDIAYTFSGGLTWTVNPHFSLNLAYSADLARNLQDNIVNPGNRDFDRHLVSLGALAKF